jgi:hypothetical protein
MSVKLKRDPEDAVNVSYDFRFPDGESPVFEIGKISRDSMTVFFIPRFFSISVTNGGPDSLTWTAAIKNNTSDEVISEYTQFIHGAKGLTVKIFEDSISEGDDISVILHNDSGAGSIIAEGLIVP